MARTRICGAVLIALVSLLGGHAIHFSTNDLIQPVPVQHVQLQYNSQFDKAVSLNKEYLLGLDKDRILKTFRVNAGLDAPGESFSGSWEDPGCEVRGQYMGHWLSGTAVLGKSSGDKEVLDRATFVVSELRKVQQALPGGYLSAFPAEHFERLRRLEGVWAPFYVIHKIMAGLLDQYLFLGNELALQMVIDEAKYFEAYIQDIVTHEGPAHWTQMLEIEYGGMEEVLFNLFDVTKDERWSRMAVYFTKPNFFNPLTKGVDTLPNRHANTHLAQVNGFAAGYEKTGDKDRLAAVAHFFDIITHAHTYATGGNNDGEYWQAPHELAPGIYGDGAGRNTEETCTTYNMMKISRYLFRWSGEPKFADYYERAVLNGMLGTQRMPAGYVSKNSVTGGSSIDTSELEDHHAERRALAEELSTRQERIDVPHLHHFPAATDKFSIGVELGYNRSVDWRQQAFAKFPGSSNDLPEWTNAPGPGVILYLLPLGSGNTKDDNWHHWSTPLNSFWCCSGSTSEQFGRLMDSIYFHRIINTSTAELYINQFTPSTLHWTLGSLDITLNATLLGKDNVARVSIGVEPFAAAEESVLKIRIPAWTEASGAAARLNGDEAVAGELTPGTYLSIRRVFKSGDCIELELPLKIRTEAIDDWRPQFQNVQAVLLGPFLLAALTDGDRHIQADPTAIADLVKQVPSGGFYSLATADDRLLCSGSKGRISAKARGTHFSGMDCSFRLLQRGLSNGEGSFNPLETLAAEGPLVIESMTRPGHFMTADDMGGLLMQPAAAADAPTWRLETDANGSTLVMEASGSQNSASGTLRIEAAVGAYPEGARLLAGRDKNFILTPLGNIVEERYSPYVEFVPPPSLQSTMEY